MKIILQAWPAIKRRLQEKTTWLGLFALVGIVNQIVHSSDWLAVLSSGDTAIHFAAAFGLIFAADAINGKPEQS